MRSASVRSFAIFAVAAMVLAACGDNKKSNATSTTPATTATEATTATTAGSGSEGGPETIKLADNRTIGKQILVDGEGRTLYVFKADTKPDTSACGTGCDETWPPVVTAGAPKNGAGVDAGDLSTFKRDDGSTQVAFSGKPLYYYASDTAAGDANGQGVGGSWYVVGKDGKKIDNDTSG